MASMVPQHPSALISVQSRFQPALLVSRKSCSNDRKVLRQDLEVRDGYTANNLGAFERLKKVNGNHGVHSSKC